MPVCIHINMISRGAHGSARAPRKRKPARAATSSTASRDDQKSKANAKAVGGLAGVFSTVPNTIGQLIFTGVFERFPNLQIPLIETGVGWIPHFLEQMDDRYWRNRVVGQHPDLGAAVVLLVLATCRPRTSPTATASPTATRSVSTT